MSAFILNTYGYNQTRFHCNLTFPALTPKTAILSPLNGSASHVLLINHMLLLFKLYFYKSRNKHRLNINDPLDNILNIKKLEKICIFDNVKKIAAYNKKWDIKNKKPQIQSKAGFATCI